ncbi:MAG: GNAT family N-acetyltransferase [Erysipelotrichaceae bacterium]|nr:GNAT family N-acetyltransferase [Erysipelotrichaceae bacterium]
MKFEKIETERLILRPFIQTDHYIINQNYQKIGYGKKALTAFIKEAFETGIHRIYAECYPRNERSWRLLESAGFKQEAHLRKNIYFHKDSDGNPIWKDTYVYAILQEDIL